MFIETEYSDSRKENARSNDQADLFSLFHVSREISGRGIVAWSVARGIKEWKKEDGGMVKGEGKRETRERFNFYP